MSEKKNEWIEKFAVDLKDKCGITPDMTLLEKVTTACGPAIYNADASTVSASDKTEIATVKKNFLINKLGLSDGPELDQAIATVMQSYGQSNRTKYRPVVYYMLTKHFNKESIFTE